jgi:outer membrane lipoprotein carrier protein
MRKIFLWALLAVVSARGPAQDLGITADEVTEKMRESFAALTTLHASFVQTVKFGFTNIEQTFQGTLSFKKPKKYRIESEHQTVVTDGKTVWLYSPVNRQLVIDHYKENTNSVSPENFLTTLPATYYISLLAREPSSGRSLLVLRMVPKDDRSFIQSVKLWIDEKKWEVRRIQVVDANETETTYALGDMKTNVRFDDSLFSFTPPAGTEIVDLR